jgi:hypothetical protein
MREKLLLVLLQLRANPSWHDGQQADQLQKEQSSLQAAAAATCEAVANSRSNAAV